MTMTPATPITYETFDHGREFILHMNGLPLAKVVYEGQWIVVPAIPTGTTKVVWAETPEVLHELDRDAEPEDALMLALSHCARPEFRRPPSFARDKAVWAHVKAKNPKAYDEWEPKDFAAANKIYGFSLRKYGENNPELAARYGIDLDAR